MTGRPGRARRSSSRTREPVPLRHQHVEQHEVDSRDERLREALLAVGGVDRLVAREAQGIDQAAPDRAVVLDYQDLSWHRRSIILRSSATCTRAPAGFFGSIVTVHFARPTPFSADHQPGHPYQCHHQRGCPGRRPELLERHLRDRAVGRRGVERAEDLARDLDARRACPCSSSARSSRRGRPGRTSDPFHFAASGVRPVSLSVRFALMSTAAVTGQVDLAAGRRVRHRATARGACRRQRAAPAPS